MLSLNRAALSPRQDTNAAVVPVQRRTGTTSHRSRLCARSHTHAHTHTHARKHLLMAYLLSNNCIKNYRNGTAIVKYIVEGWVVYFCGNTAYIPDANPAIDCLIDADQLFSSIALIKPFICCCRRRICGQTSHSKRNSH